MGIDGIFLYCLKNEIATACQGARVEKIHQPSKEELVLLFHSFQGQKRLLISVRPSSPRVNFTLEARENPASPPMFCMLMRKHLGGARFVGIEDTGFERVITLSFRGTNEMGDAVDYRLVCELIGKQTNIVLVDSDGKIIECLKRSDIESGGRLVQPGAVYRYPDKQQKIGIFELSSLDLADRISKSSEPLAKAILNAIDGVSPLISREVAVRKGLDTELRANEMSDDEVISLAKGIDWLKESIENARPVAFIDESGVPFEFSFTDIMQYGRSAKSKGFETFSMLLDFVFWERDRQERIKLFASDLVKLLGNLKSRIAKKIAVRQKELERCGDGERFRIYGELLKANAGADARGLTFIDVANYYDSEFKTVRIPLDSSLSVMQNAQRYFKEYRKCCNASAVLGDLIEQSQNEAEYIDSVINELSRATTVADLREIRSELIAAGYIKATTTDKKRKDLQPSKPLEFVSPDGFKVLVGRNNRQNDELTLRMADKGDIWFHTKNIAGSHVIVCSNGKELPESTVLFAAKLAALHSNAALSSAVPVDYTPVKYVKKPAGAKPGMVIYKTNKTVYVTPERN